MPRLTVWLLLALPAWAAPELPVTSFETEPVTEFRAAGARIERTDEVASDGRYSLRVTAPGSAADSWPGVRLQTDSQNWTRRQRLLFDAHNPTQAPLSLSYRLDTAGRENYFGSIQLAPGWNRDLAVDLVRLLERVNLRAVRGLLLYIMKPRETVVFCLDRVRWEMVADSPVGMITSFESEEELPRAGGAKLSRVPDYVMEGDWALRVDFPGSPNDSWPGFTLPGGDWSGRHALAMDVFLAGNEPVSVSFRLDDDAPEPHRSFSSQTLQPGWNRAWTLSVAGLSEGIDLARVKQLFVYLRMPRKDVTIYVDALRWVEAPDPWQRWVHLDLAAGRPAAADEEAAGFMLSADSYLRLVFAGTRPTRRPERLELFAARSEFEPLTVTVHALRDLAGATVAVSDLTGPDGAALPAAAWDLRYVRHLNKRTHYAAVTYIAGVPTYLASLDEPVAVAAGQAQRFWLTCQAPASQPAGHYTGTVTVTADGHQQVVPVALRVLPFELPESSDLLYGEYYRPWGSADLASMRRDLEDMRAHGMTSIGLTMGLEEAAWQRDGETYRFDLDVETRLTSLLRWCQELGYPAPFVLLSDTGQQAAGLVGAYGSPEYDAAYTAFHQGLHAALAARRWPTLYIQPVDEPGWKDEAERQRNVHLLKLLKAVGLPTEQDGPGDDYFHRAAGPYSDIWNYNGAIGPAEMVDRALADGRLITFYNNDVEGWRPETDRFAYGLFNWKYRMHGGYNWHYRTGRGNLYDDFDSTHGDWVHNYPANDQHPGGPSTGWEGSREGVDDRRYLLLAERLVERARGGGDRAAAQAAVAAAWLDDLRERLPDDRRVRGRAKFDEQRGVEALADLGVTDELALSAVIGDLKHPTGLSFAEYDVIRWAVAAQCLDLLAAIEGRPAPQPTAWQPTQTAAGLTVTERREHFDPAAAARPVVRIPTLAATPTIDGLVDDDRGWQGAGTASLVLAGSGGQPDAATLVRYGLAGDRFYVAFTCEEELIGQLTSTVTDADGPVWKDDCVEVFLDPGTTGGVFYQVVVNSLGTIGSYASDGTGWDPPIEAAARVETEARRWLVELSIPTEGLELAPRFGLNFARERRPTEAMELTTWAPVGTRFGTPERFGVGVISGDATAEVITVATRVEVSCQPGYQYLGDQTATVTIHSRLAEAARPGATLHLSLSGNGGEQTVAVPGPLADITVAELATGGLPAGTYTLTAELRCQGAEPVRGASRLTRLAGPFE